MVDHQRSALDDAHASVSTVLMRRAHEEQTNQPATQTQTRMTNWSAACLVAGVKDILSFSSFTLSASQSVRQSIRKASRSVKPSIIHSFIHSIIQSMKPIPPFLISYCLSILFFIPSCFTYTFILSTVLAYGWHHATSLYSVQVYAITFCYPQLKILVQATIQYCTTFVYKVTPVYKNRSSTRLASPRLALPCLASSRASLPHKARTHSAVRVLVQYSTVVGVILASKSHEAQSAQLDFFLSNRPWQWEWWFFKNLFKNLIKVNHKKSYASYRQLLFMVSGAYGPFSFSSVILTSPTFFFGPTGDLLNCSTKYIYQIYTY